MSGMTVRDYTVSILRAMVNLREAHKNPEFPESFFEYGLARIASRLSMMQKGLGVDNDATEEIKRLFQWPKDY